MNQLLVEAMRDYLAAGESMDLERLGGYYDDAFLNPRVDQAGQVVPITKAQFMQRFADMTANGMTLEPADDASFPTTTTVGDIGIAIMRRVKDGLPVLYAFLWRLRDGQPTTILRELTFEHDLTDLIQMIQAVQTVQPAAPAQVTPPVGG